MSDVLFSIGAVVDSQIYDEIKHYFQFNKKEKEIGPFSITIDKWSRRNDSSEDLRVNETFATREEAVAGAKAVIEAMNFMFKLKDTWSNWFQTYTIKPHRVDTTYFFSKGNDGPFTMASLVNLYNTCGKSKENKEYMIEVFSWFFEEQVNSVFGKEKKYTEEWTIKA